MKKKIGIIGCGNMGEAILAQSVKRKAQNFIIFEKDKLKQALVCRIYRVKAAIDITDLLYKSDIIIIAVKPQDIDAVLGHIQKGIKICKKRKILIISIAAGVKTEYIERRIAGDIKLIRAMPNLPATIGEGITALVKGRFASNNDLKIAISIFGAFGETVVIQKEALIDVVTALSGSGPAYLFFIVSVMLAAAEGLGMDRKSANSLIYHTVIGSADLLKKEKFDAKALIGKVASKGGTTEAALKVFKERGLRSIIIDALQAAHKRAKELSKR